MSHIWARGAALITHPGFECQHGPKRRGGILPAGKMIAPARADEIRVQPPGRSHGTLVEQVLGPAAKRSLDPFTDRNAEAGFRAVEQFPRHMTTKQRPQDVLAPALADLQLQ